MLSRKKLLSLTLAMAICAATAAGCSSSSSSTSSQGASTGGSSTGGTSSGASTGGSSTAGTSSDSSENPYAEEITIEILKRSDAPTEYVNTLHDDMLKEKFNMVWKESYVSGSDMATKLSTLYASGMEPDLIWAVRPAWGSDEWTDAGYFRGFTEEEILSLIPGYEHLWDSQNPDAWEYIWNYLSWSDGKIYTLPTARDTAGNMAWLYRQDIFDQCGIDSFPSNPDEFLEVCRLIKEQTGITPLVDRNDTPLFVISKWGMMYGLPDMLPDMPCFENPVTGEMYYYVYATDTYRELLKLAHTLVEEGLMYAEFATASTDQANAYIAQGNKAMMFDYPEKIATHNATQVDAVPNVDWQWTDVVPSISTEKAAIKKDNYHAADLRAFAATATDEQVERMCAYFQWCTTEEGITFNSYGVEGVTYDIIDGVKTFKEEFATPLKATGTDLGTYQVGGRGMWRGEEYISTYKPVLAEWTEKILNNPKNVYVMPPVMKFTPEEQSSMVDTNTYLTDAVNEWLLRFMNGQKDPYNDADWNEYIQVLESLGLHDVEELNKTVYERSGN